MAAVAVLACALLLGVTSPAKADPGRVYITLGFDDGARSQYEHRGLLAHHGYAGTYYVNSFRVGKSPLEYMDWDELTELADAGHEIGGHTRDHTNLTDPLAPGVLEDEVCGDRDELIAHGFSPSNFAYPFGLHNAAARQMVQDCGYDTGRTTGGLDVPPDCCEYVERPVPPRPYQLRAVMPGQSTTLQEIQDVITWARDNGGGWLPLVFHDLCDGADCANFDEFAVDTTLFAQLLDWISHDPLLRVRTAAQVLAIPQDTTAPVVDLTTPAVDSELTVGSHLHVAAAATDEVAVDQVEFLIDGQVVRTDHRAPYGFGWNAPAMPGTHTIEARAYDDAGNVTTSERVVSVVPVPPAPSVTQPQQTPSVLNPLARIASLRKVANKRHWRLTVTLGNPSHAKRLQVLSNGRVVRTVHRPANRHVFTLRPSLGRHTIKVRAIGIDDRPHHAGTRKLRVKKK